MSRDYRGTAYRACPAELIGMTDPAAYEDVERLVLLWPGGGVVTDRDRLAAETPTQGGGVNPHCPTPVGRKHILRPVGSNHHHVVRGRRIDEERLARALDRVDPDYGPAEGRLLYTPSGQERQASLREWAAAIAKAYREDTE